MPINGEQCASFLGIKGENCSFLNIRGVKVLRDEFGNDLLSIIRTGISGQSNSNSSVNNMLGRLDSIEKFLQDMPVQAPVSQDLEKKLMAKISALEKTIQELSIEAGTPGPPGIQGAKGASGAKTMQALEDVNLDGLDDGAMMVWSSKQKKWIISLEE